MSTSAPRSRSGRSRGRSYHHGDLRNALIEATVELIPAAGVRGLSLREVARAAGVSHAASYRHFRDKESLLAAVAETGFSNLGEALRRAAQSAGPDPVAKLQAAGVAYVEFAMRHPAHLHVMFGGAIGSFDRYPTLLASARAARAELHEVVAEISRKGSAGEAEEEVLEAAAWSIVHGLSVLLADGQMRRQDGTQLSRRAGLSLAQAVTQLFCAGLAA
ncbi:MAG TPA: TetR/AcrR family transcriptional regulator [Steroidobacteraceae bacterium]|nr:TetR/AcrR family transcriptional regulator [Steroidobacteraceae bacterium]